MKAVFGIVSLVIVLALAGGLVKRQLASGVTSGVAPGAAPTDTTPRAQARALEDQARTATERALQQGVQRNDAAER